MLKITLHNRKQQRIVAEVQESVQPTGLVFIMHGLGGYKEQPQLLAMSEAFFEAGYTVVRFDTTNTLGESDGDYADATVTNYYEDLEDIIVWATGQTWYQEPFVLVGHSLGGLSVALFAEKFPQKVKALAPISTVVSGQLSMEIKKVSGELEEWKRTGWRISKSESKPGIIKRLKWSHMEDRLLYDLLPQASKLTMPVLLIVGDQDDTTPPEQQKMLFDRVPGKKELHIITRAPHTFKDRHQVAEVKSIFKKWITVI